MVTDRPNSTPSGDGSIGRLDVGAAGGAGDGSPRAPGTQVDRIGRACQDLIADWRRGERRPAEDYIDALPGHPPDSDELFELVYSEYLVREEAGLPALEPLVCRFPDLADRLRLQANLHTALVGEPEFTSVAFLSDTRLDTAAEFGADPLGRETPVGYEIRRVLGRGGMGIVYEARQIRLNRVVAVKMIRAGELASDEERARFLAEAEAIARLRHPNIVQIHALGECDGRPFFEMELVDGGSLADRIGGVPRPPRDASALMETIARAIHEAHCRGIVHRDLKPSNILLMTDGSPKIVDFGLAKLIGSDSGLTRTDSVLGSPAYMAPEQAGGAGVVGPAADVYALGAIFYEMLTGRPPFVAESAIELLGMAMAADPVPPTRLRAGLHRDLETICLRCLEKDPGRRYATAEAMADDLGRWLRGDSILARPAGLIERAYRWSARNRAVAALLASIGLLLVGGTTGLALLWALARAEATNARDAASREALARVELARTSTDLEIDHGITLAEAGDVSRCLDLLGRAARLDPDGPLGRVALANISAWSPLLPLAIASAGLPDEPVALVVSGDRRTVAIGFKDGSLGFLQAGGLRAIATTAPRPGSLLRGLALRSDGRVAASGTSFPDHPEAGSMVQLWDVPTGRPIGEPIRRKQGRPLAFSPDGSTLAAGFGDLILLIESDSGRVLASRVIERDVVYGIAFAPDGSMVVAVTQGEWAHRLDARTGAPLGRPIRLAGVGECVTFHPDGSRFAVGFGSYHAEKKVRRRLSGVQVYRASNGEPDGPQLPHEARVDGLAYHPDGRALLTGDHTGQARLWDLEGRPIGDVLRNDGPLYQVDFSPDGSVAMTQCLSGATKLWNPTTGAQVGATLNDPAFSAFDDVGRLVRAAGLTVRSFELAGVLAQARTCQPPARGLEFFRDGRSVVANYGNYALIVSAENGRPIGWPMPHRDQIQAIAVSPCGRLVATGSRDATVRIWDDQGRATIPPIPIPHWSASLCFSPDGRRLLSADETGRVRLVDTATGKTLDVPLLHPHQFDGSHVIFTGFSRDGGIGYSVTNAATVARLDGRSGEPIGEIWDVGTRVTGARLSPDDRSILLVCDDAIRILDAATGRDRLPAIGTSIRSACFTPDGGMIVGGGGDKAIHFWDGASGKPIGEPIRRPQAVDRVEVSPDGRSLLVLDNGWARIWDVLGRKPIGPVRPYDYALAPPSFSPDGRLFAITDDATRLFDTPAPSAASVSAEPRGDEWHGTVGMDLKLRNDRTAALWHFDRLVAALPDDWRARALRSEILFDLGRQPEAAREAARARLIAGPSASARWDARVGLDALAQKRWTAAVAALDRSMNAVPPGQPALMDARGIARAKLGDWAHASSDLAHGTWRQYSMLLDSRQAMLVALKAGDRGFYRDLMQRMIPSGRAPSTQAMKNRSYIAWLGSIGPGSVDDPGILVGLAEPACGLTGDDAEPYLQINLAAALYRAGRYDEAVARILGARRTENLDEFPESRAFLAMAYQRLGKANDARKWLALAEKWSLSDDPGEELTRELLIQEARTVVLDFGFPSDPFCR